MTYDAVIIGGGHNGLVAACYLAKAGKKVLILEKNDYLGGASTSQKVFPDYDANLSRYAYLVSLFPTKIFEELGINITLLRRNISSYTPYVKDGVHQGLLISNVDKEVSKKSILELGYGESEWVGYKIFLKKQQEFAEFTWDSFLEPLKSKDDWKNYFQEKNQLELWNSFVEEPIGKLIEQHVKSDILRGVLLTDAKIGSYTHAHDESLLQNRTFLYHIVGNKTGEWRVPAGGMGNLANQLVENAMKFGVTLKINATVINIDAANNEITYEENGEQIAVKATHILSNAAPQCLENFGIKLRNTVPEKLVEGTAFKINMLLKKLPNLKDKSISSEEAFAGTFHIDESYTQLQKTFEEASLGKVTEKLAGEIYCHTLTDGSILSAELREKGYHTLTFFGLDLPYELFIKDNEETKKIVVSRFLSGINKYLEEPLEDCLARDKNGKICLEAKSSYDLEKDLALPRGNIFHNSLSWFYAENPEEINTWGVETQEKNVIICGSGASRGGAVSGIGGRNAAIHVLGQSE